MLGNQQFDEVGKVRRPHVVRQPRGLGRIAGVEGFGYGIHEARRSLLGLLLGFAHDLVLLGHRPAYIRLLSWNFVPQQGA